MSSTLKNIFIFVLIFAALAGGYYFFFANKVSTPDLSTISTSGSVVDSGMGAGVGGEFLTTLLNIKNIQLDDSIFSSTAFKSLQDFTTELVDQGNAGRPNPFAPIGADTSASAVVTPVPGSTTTIPGTNAFTGIPAKPIKP